MKVVRDHPRQLILEDRPLLVTVVLSAMALIFIALGLGTVMAGEVAFGLLWLGFTVPFFALFLVIFIRRNQLILDAGTGEVIHRRKTLLGYSQHVRELRHLDRAIVQTSRSSEGGSTHRMALVYGGGMDEGTHPFTAVYTSGKGARRGTEAVNAWLEQLRAQASEPEATPAGEAGAPADPAGPGRAGSPA